MRIVAKTIMTMLYILLLIIILGVGCIQDFIIITTIYVAVMMICSPRKKNKK
jgi:hypothetical protein